MNRANAIVAYIALFINPTINLWRLLYYSAHRSNTALLVWQSNGIDFECRLHQYLLLENSFPTFVNTIFQALKFVKKLKKIFLNLWLVFLEGSNDLVKSFKIISEYFEMLNLGVLRLNNYSYFRWLVSLIGKEYFCRVNEILKRRYHFFKTPNERMFWVNHFYLITLL